MWHFEEPNERFALPSRRKSLKFDIRMKNTLNVVRRKEIIIKCVWTTESVFERRERCAITWSDSLISNFPEIVFGLDGIGLDRVRFGKPSGRADFSMLFDKLEGLHQTQSLIDRASHGEVVDGHLTENLLWIDEEHSPQCHSVLLDQHAIVPGDFLVEIR